MTELPRHPFVDVHCHLLPGIDDGSDSWQETLAMARMAVNDGIRTIVVTPHQLGNFAHNTGDKIRLLTQDVQTFLDENDVPLRLFPGGDVRIEEGLVDRLQDGSVLTLADHRKHVLLELPHELYFPLDRLLKQLKSAGMVGVLSHPERNQGLLSRPQLLEQLVDQGCLLQITAGSLCGTFGGPSQQLSEWAIRQRLVHFVSTDAHGARARRPLLGRAFEIVAGLAGLDTAIDLCSRNPSLIADGKQVPPGNRSKSNQGRWGWFSWRKAG